MQYDKIHCWCCCKEKHQSFMIPGLCRECVIETANWAAVRMRMEKTYDDPKEIKEIICQEEKLNPEDK